ncbi:unnamed protein product [Prorocentrum cordatum]|uniref:Uncharacterized protein n=1 Tax=Prorocentrum cordatum TaxID=2364126 RepID=A0ABN9RNP1_9DINO|nr:unnamed protein product [Polarella glacialis]
MADARSGADALGECRDFTDAKNQALGAAEQEGEQEGPAAAVDEERRRSPPASSRPCPPAAAQPPDQLAPELRPQPGDERGEAPAGAEAPRGSASLVHASAAALRAVGDERGRGDGGPGGRGGRHRPPLQAGGGGAAALGADREVRGPAGGGAVRAAAHPGGGRR